MITENILNSFDKNYLTPSKQASKPLLKKERDMTRNNGKPDSPDATSGE